MKLHQLKVCKCADEINKHNYKDDIHRQAHRSQLPYEIYKNAHQTFCSKPF